MYEEYGSRSDGLIRTDDKSVDCERREEGGVDMSEMRKVVCEDAKGYDVLSIEVVGDEARVGVSRVEGGVEVEVSTFYTSTDMLLEVAEWVRGVVSDEE